MSKIKLKSQDRGDLTKCEFSVSLFLVFNQTSNNFFETPCIYIIYHISYIMCVYIYTYTYIYIYIYIFIYIYLYIYVYIYMYCEREKVAYPWDILRDFFNLMFVGMVKFIIQALGEKSLQSFYPVVLMRF